MDDEESVGICAISTGWGGVGKLRSLIGGPFFTLLSLHSFLKNRCMYS